jgi:hypothetical protein
MDRFVPLVLKFLLEDDCCRRLGVECKADHFYFHRLEFSTLDLSDLSDFDVNHGAQPYSQLWKRTRREYCYSNY